MRSGSGKPPGGWPSDAAHVVDHRLGEGQLVRRSVTARASSPCFTIQIAMSPTTFDDGVTLGMSPNRRLTSA